MKKPMIHKKQGMILALCAVALIAIGAYVFHAQQVKATAEEVIYTEVKAEIGSVRQTLTAIGEITAAEEKNLIFSKSKVFKGMCAEVNEYVPAGEPLALYADGTTLHADHGGVIAEINAPRTGKKGDGVQSLTLLTTDQVHLNLTVPEDEINRITPNQAVDITVNGSAKKYQGTVTYIGGSSLTAIKNATDNSNGKDEADTNNKGNEAEDSTDGTAQEDREEQGKDDLGDAKFIAVITLDNDGSLRPGMSAECTVLLEQHDNVVIVPITAIYGNGNEHYVEVENGETIEKTTVTTGISDANNVEILSGLKGTEKLRIQIKGIDDKKAAGDK